MCGATNIDPFEWLEQDSEQTKAWLEHQEVLLKSSVSMPVRPALEEVVSAFLRTTIITTPYKVGQSLFYSRRNPDQSQPGLFRLNEETGRETTLIAAEQYSEHTSFSLMAVSPDARVVAVAFRVGGQDEVVVRLLDVATGEILARLPSFMETRASLMPDFSGYFHVRANGRYFDLCIRRFGPLEIDTTLLSAVAVPSSLHVCGQTSDDGRIVYVRLNPEGFGSEAQFCLVNRTDGSITPRYALPGVAHVSCVGTSLFVRTTWKAPRGRIMRFSHDRPDPEEWEEVIAECPPASALANSYPLVLD